MSSVFKKHPELLNEPDYNHKRFPSSFEDALLMVLEQNHLYAERINLKDPYEIDFAIKKTNTHETVFYAEAELDASGKLFNKDGTIAYEYVNVPARKFRYFKKEKPSIYVKGSRNLRWVLVLDGNHILQFGKLKEQVPCRFKDKVFTDDLIVVQKQHAIERCALFHGSLQEWLQLAKKLHSFQILLSPSRGLAETTKKEQQT